MAEPYDFLKSCHDYIESGVEHVVRFVLASNDGSERMLYAEGLVAVHHLERFRGIFTLATFALRGQGTCYANVNRHWVDLQSQPFDPHATRQLDFTIYVSESSILIDVEGVTIVNPSFAPGYTPAGVRYAGVVFGLEEVPAGFPSEKYQKTLWSISLQKGTQPIPK